MKSACVIATEEQPVQMSWKVIGSQPPPFWIALATVFSSVARELLPDP